MRKYVYCVEFFVTAGSLEEAHQKIKAKLVETGFVACEDENDHFVGHLSILEE
jgi:hypothetical protein